MFLHENSLNLNLPRLVNDDGPLLRNPTSVDPDQIVKPLYLLPLLLPGLLRLRHLKLGQGISVEGAVLLALDHGRLEVGDGLVVLRVREEAVVFVRDLAAGGFRWADAHCDLNIIDMHMLTDRSDHCGYLLRNSNILGEFWWGALQIRGV